MNSGFPKKRRARLRPLQERVTAMRVWLSPPCVSLSCRCLDTAAPHVAQRCLTARPAPDTTAMKDVCVLDALAAVAVGWGMLRFPVLQDPRSLYRAVFAAAEVLDGLDTARDELAFARDLQAAVASGLDQVSRAAVPYPYPNRYAAMVPR